MVDIISLAHGVAERIGEADVELAPEYSLKDVKDPAHPDGDGGDNGRGDRGGIHPPDSNGQAASEGIAR